MIATKPALTLVVLLLSATLVTACGRRANQPNQNQASTPTPTPSAEEQEQSYRSKVVAILSPHFTGKQTSGITQALLALTVPARYQDLHLQLVLAFSKFDAARTNSDAEAAEAAAVELAGVLEQYPWIDGQP